MALVGSVAVARNVGRPFVFRRVGVPGADVFLLEGLEELLGAEFICLYEVRRLVGGLV